MSYLNHIAQCFMTNVLISFCKLHNSSLDEFISASFLPLIKMIVIHYCVLVYVTACPGPPEAPTLNGSIPPNVDLSWSPPSASGAWSYTYEVSRTNGSVIVTRQADTTAQITGLQAETHFTVVVTAYPDSTLCPDQATTFMFMTTQSK